MPTRPGKQLDTFDNPLPERDYTIHIEIPELASFGNYGHKHPVGGKPIHGLFVPFV